jgi:hypothetical protein
MAASKASFSLQDTDVAPKDVAHGSKQAAAAAAAAAASPAANNQKRKLLALPLALLGPSADRPSARAAASDQALKRVQAKKLVDRDGAPTLKGLQVQFSNAFDALLAQVDKSHLDVMAKASECEVQVGVHYALLVLLWKGRLSQLLAHPSISAAGRHPAAPTSRPRLAWEVRAASKE